VRDNLEVYFLQFPVSLLEYRSLKYAYQAEAMVWFHGIYMLTCTLLAQIMAVAATHGSLLIAYFPDVHRDLSGLLSSSVLSSTLEFFSAFDHSILLGEV